MLAPRALHVFFLAGLLAWPAPAQQRLGQLRRMLPPVPSTDVELADVDGDGDLDALVATGGRDLLVVNDGSGVLRHDARRLVAEAAQATEAVAFGDADGDGDLDLARAGSPNRLSMNDGGGRFVDAAGLLPVDPGSDRDLAFGDVDGDGDLDLWLTEQLFVNDGTGAFADATGQVAVALVSTHALALGDVDLDGDLDAVLGRFGDELLLRNDGAGSYADASDSLPADPDWTVSVVLGDLDDDGDPDLALANRMQVPDFQAPNRLYENDGPGTFVDATGSLQGAGGASTVVRVADVDGDLDADLYFGNDVRMPAGGFPPIALPGAPDVLLLDEGGSFVSATPAVLQVLDGTQGAAFGDVDGDGDADLLLAGGTSRLLLNDGAGGFREAGGAVPAGVRGANAAAVGDVDGDGAPDVLLAGGSTYEDQYWNALLRGDGTGAFVDATGDLPPQPPQGPYGPTWSADVALGDVDGDGDLDAVFANPAYDSPQDNLLWLNDGSGVFSDATGQLPSYASWDRGYTYAVELLDLDGDGHLDVVLGGVDDDDGGGGGVALYLNDGAGTFTDVTALSPYVGSETRILLAGDVDGDEDVDLFTVWATPFPLGTVHLLLNDGSGAFTDGTGQLPPVAGNGVVQWADLGDVDGDGHLDLVLGRFQDGGPVNLQYRNDGDGFFTEVAAAMPPDVVPHRLGDVDGDGDLDLLRTGGLFLNDGSGQFFAAPGALPLDPGAQTVELADLDRDGDLDALLARGSQVLVWSNLARQLAWRGVPRLGQPLALDVYGPPGEPYLLAAASATAELSTPWGVLFLHPATVFLTVAGVLDGNGRGALVLLVPSDPTLVGASLPWQAAVGLAPRLTNLERTRFTAL